MVVIHFFTDVFHYLIRLLAVVLAQAFSISQHCSAIQLSFALLISCLIFLLTSLYFAAPSGYHFLLFNSLLLSQRFRMSAVTLGFFVRRCFPRISLSVSVTILLKVLVSKFTSVFLSSSMIRGAHFHLYDCHVEGICL